MATRPMPFSYWSACRYVTPIRSGIAAGSRPSIHDPALAYPPAANRAPALRDRPGGVVLRAIVCERAFARSRSSRRRGCGTKRQLAHLTGILAPEGYLTPHTHATVAVSDRTRSELVARYGFQPGVTRMIPIAI
jgi:hypothetical protein